jgi:ATP-dependent DNA helicase RecG
MPTTRTELLDILRNGENSAVEFKRDDITVEQLAKELVAFSNFDGGMVLLGVEDDGNVSGITRTHPKLEEWVMTSCRDKIRPAIIPFYEVLRDVVVPGKDVAVVRVPAGFNVQSVWHNSRHIYYIRVGTQSREPTPEELSRLFQQRGTFRAELRPVSGATFNDLDLRRLKDYFGRVRKQDDIPGDDDLAGWQALLLNTELMAEDGITLSAVLLFGRNPNRFLPQAGIDAAAFPGTEKDYAAVERIKLRGPLTPLMNEQAELVETGLVEQAFDFVRRNTGTTATLEDGVRRKERPAYPPEAIREVLVNALIHRDYLLAATDIELSVYSDRVEVISPGRLPNGITTTRMRAGCRAARNQLLKDIMRDYGYLEHMGLGVPRKIVKCMLENNGTDPVLLEEDERFTVRLLAGTARD